MGFSIALVDSTFNLRFCDLCNDRRAPLAFRVYFCPVLCCEKHAYKRLIVRLKKICTLPEKVKEYFEFPESVSPFCSPNWALHLKNEMLVPVVLIIRLCTRSNTSLCKIRHDCKDAV